MIIVVLGPDGCGKTTIVDRLAISLDDNVCTYETRVKIFPTLSQLVRLVGIKRAVNIKEPGSLHMGMEVPVNSLLRSILICCWYGLEFVASRFVLDRAKVHVFARYFYDYYYQRVNRNLPLWVIRFFQKLGPRPDYVFMLHRDPHVIYSQKPELTVDEIILEYELIESSLSGSSNFYRIDADAGVDATVEEIMGYLQWK